VYTFPYVRKFKIVCHVNASISYKCPVLRQRRYLFIEISTLLIGF
jgi:hypothetical protein